MSKTRMYNIEQVVEVRRLMVAIADHKLYAKGYLDQWVTVPLPFDQGDEVKSICSTGEEELILLTKCGAIYKICAMCLVDVAFKRTVHKDWTKHWRRIPTGIHQKEVSDE